MLQVGGEYMVYGLCFFVKPISARSSALLSPVKNGQNHRLVTLNENGERENDVPNGK